MTDIFWTEPCAVSFPLKMKAGSPGTRGGKSANGTSQSKYNADKNSNSKNWKSGQKKKLKFTYQEQKDYECIEGEMVDI